jgi:thioredoxin reductase (NADPH)
VKQPLEEELSKECLNVYFLKRVVEIREKDIVLENESGEIETFPNDVVFILIGADAELRLLTTLGVETRQSKYGKIPVYDDETFETNVSGVYVAGHFTEVRHIAGAIQVPKKVIPKIAAKFAKAEAFQQK